MRIKNLRIAYPTRMPEHLDSDGSVPLPVVEGRRMSKFSGHHLVYQPETHRNWPFEYRSEPLMTLRPAIDRSGMSLRESLEQNATTRSSGPAHALTQPHL